MPAFSGKLNSLSGFKPMNNLNGSKQNPSRPVRSSPIHHRPPSPLAPSPKRQKVEESNAHTQAQFVLIPEHDEIAARSVPRKRSFDNHSDSQQTFISQSSAKGVQSTRAVVPELRVLDSFTRPQPKNRPRYTTPKRHVGQLGREVGAGTSFVGSDNEDSDGDVEIVAPGAMPTPQTHQPSEVRHSIEAVGKRFKTTSGAQRLEDIIDNTMLNENGSISLVSSPDELAPKTQDIKEKMPAKRPAPSPSLSKRADIPRTKFTQPSGTRLQAPGRGLNDLDRAMKIIHSPLLVVQAVSGGQQYEADKKNNTDKCFLNLREMSHILHPVDSEGQLMKAYAYLTVNLHKVQKIRALPRTNCLIASVQRPIDGSISGGQKLIIKFSSPADLEAFVNWARMNKRDAEKLDLVDESTSQDRLERELDNLMLLAGNRTVSRDNESRGDDMKLIEHNLANARQARTTNPPHVLPRSEKLKDAMRHSFPSLSNPQVTVLPEDAQPHNISRQVRLTRSTFAVESSSSRSESPEPEGWTTQHVGWEKNWRNSLVFPPHGKGRATVDKDDIPRLDEGQFLNDNLIIFYLRYLQHTLEAQRPDLAERIYFQNTYFYEKLKSAKSTTQSINYDSVKAWTSKVDLFTKDYIIVPINEYSHWYVAIIYNAPKLVPSPDKTEGTSARPKNTITIEEDVEDSREVSRGASSASSDSAKSDEPTSSESVKSIAQSDVTNHFSLPDTEGRNAEIQLIGYKQDGAAEMQHSDVKGDVEHIEPSNDHLQRKKTAKGYGTGTRKHNPDQPKIITLDSLGLAHSPACSCLKQYLIAELKDKRGIEIPNPGALGMTAKDVPQQTNHCDCGLYLLGYITEFLKDPDGFVRNILSHQAIDWNLNPSELRNNIRDLIFDLQKEQQCREDLHKEEKRNKAILLKRRARGSIDERPLKQPLKEQITCRDVPEPLEKDDIHKEIDVVQPKPKLTTPEASTETRPISNSENRPIPGSYPRSPAVASASVTASNENNTERTKTPKFVSPLPESSRGSSPTRPMVVDDSEVLQVQTENAKHIHDDSKRTNLPEKPAREMHGPCHDHDKPVDQTRKQEDILTHSPYFAGRQPGDKMASAKLREEPVHSDIIDISD
ncbi:cysteine proteinase [Daldinia caldariorum]|uniref:cysteine proteinase n=1 Tax=Daldinia caldariorum TaxID=326644 RepID=UPI00200829A7|nr:cysteine proteinase [Daldinia caldariorum]KAI1468416.1 cysteine proteinase [Daldinia caldariorum]